MADDIGELSFDLEARTRAKEQELIAKGITFKQAIYMLASSMVAEERIDELNEEIRIIRLATDEMHEESIRKLRKDVFIFASYTKQWKTIAILREEQLKKSKAKATTRAKKAAKARHNKPGGNLEKREAIRAAWATGKYASRDLCAEQECAALGMAFGTARRALRGTPDPA